MRTETMVCLEQDGLTGIRLSVRFLRTRQQLLSIKFLVTSGERVLSATDSCEVAAGAFSRAVAHAMREASTRGK